MIQKGFKKMRKNGKARKLISGCLALVSLLSTTLSPVMTYAADPVEERIPYYEEVKEQLDADELLILTSVEKVSVNFHKQDEEELGEISVAQAKEYMAEGQFEANTMLPKIQASVEFVEQGEGKKAVITSIDKAVDAYLGRTGTVIC